MNSKFDLLDESTMDIEDLQVERDAQLAAVDAIRRARRFGTYYVISENEQVKQIPGDKTGPYEEQLLARAAKLGGRIEELQSRETQQSTVLNDKPAPKSSQQ